MSRTAIYSALVLRSRPFGERNNEVSLLTAEEGIVRATLFGGPKSKLRAYAAPYNSGQVWIYRDKAKDYGKVSDFDVHSWRAELRELYERAMAASAVAETVLYTHGGGGDWGPALKLATAALDALENADEKMCERLLVHFLWRWTAFLGFQPQVDICAACGKKATDSPMWFSVRENNVFCENCVSKSSSVPPGLLQLNPGCCRWLASTLPLEPSHLNRYSMDNKSFREAKTLVTTVLTGALGKRLASWDWG
jgi:DNA repair protein RecO (recombination protein O)